MAKSLIGLIPEKTPSRINNEQSQEQPSRFCNIGELFCMKKLDIKSPLYILKDSNMNNLMSSFKDGYSHLAIVCSNDEGIKQLF